VGKGTVKAYEKGEWGGDVVGAWSALIFPHPLAKQYFSSHRERELQVIIYLHKIDNECSPSFKERARER
jgi:hypothetical protein